MNRIVWDKSLCLHFQLFVYVLATLRSDWGYGFTTNTYIVTHKLLSCTKKERFVWRWKSINYFGIRVSRKSKKKVCFVRTTKKKWKWIWIISRYLLQQICLWFFHRSDDASATVKTFLSDFKPNIFQSQRKSHLEYSYYVRKVREKNKGEISKRKRRNKDSWYGNQSGLTREKWYLLENYSQIFTFRKTKNQVCSIPKFPSVALFFSQSLVYLSKYVRKSWRIQIIT